MNDTPRDVSIARTSPGYGDPWGDAGRPSNSSLSSGPVRAPRRHCLSCHGSCGPRENLEDAAAAFCLQRADAPDPIALCIVADGVGGRQFGEIASAMALQILTAHVTSMLITPATEAISRPATATDARPISHEQIGDFLIEALDHANEAIVRAADRQPQWTGMGTTAVCAVIIDSMLIVAWCGDSRCYVIGDGAIDQVTADHSQVQGLIDAGLLEPARAKEHPLAHTITRFLGRPDSCQPEVVARRLGPDDTVLLCTDGLTDVVSDACIAHTVNRARHRTDPRDSLPFASLAPRLVSKAIDAGTKDNVTVVCHTQMHEQGLPASCQHTHTDLYHNVVATTLQRLTKETCHA